MSANRTQIGMMPERLPFQNVANMYFNHSAENSSYRVSKCNRCMGVSSCIENNTLRFKSIFLNPVNKPALVVTLKINNIMLRVAVFQLRNKFIESYLTVNVGLPFSHHIEVGAIDDCD